jgi:hypothetical protein
MAVDRSKFKKTSASQLAQSDKELNKQLGKKDRTNSNGHEIEEGLNLFRAYPAHPEGGENDLFVHPFVQTFVPAMVQEKNDKGEVIKGDDGKPKLKLSVRPVFNSKVHGGFKRDLIEEYIGLAFKNAKEMGLSEEDRKEYLKPIFGTYSKDPKKNVNGINYPLAWVMYADKYPNGNSAATPIFDELRIKKSVKERLNKLAAIESSNDPMGTDPFTDLEEGRAFKVIKDKEAENPQNIYTTELDNSTVNEIVNGRSVKIQKNYPLSDEQLENFLKQEPLSVKYGKKVATRKNFESQLTGLQLLDDKWEMGIFELPEWSQIVSEIDSYYSETDEVSEDENNDDSQVEDEVSGDEFDLMDRKELQVYCKEYKTGILARPTLSDDDLREKLREWKKSMHIEHKPLPGEDGYVEEVKETSKDVMNKSTPEERQAFLDDLNGVTKKEESTSTSTLSSKDKLAQLRARMKTS